MARAFTDQQTISAPRSSVWGVLTDWGRAASWMPGVDSLSNSGPLAEGTQLTFTARGKDRTSRIAECTPESALTLDSSVGGVRASYRYTLESAGDATRVALVVDVETSGAMKLLGPVIRSAIAKADGGQLAQLKRLVEQG